MKEKVYGNLGEDIAANYLKTKGYEILSRNFTGRGYEIDIVARDNDYIVFCEVKTRRSRSFGSAVDAVDDYKIKNIVYGAENYIYKNNLYGYGIRFDVIEVYTNEGKINHIENAFDGG